MPRPPLRLLGAPTNLGLKPYDDGTPRRVDEAPAVLRGLDLAARLATHDLGDVAADPYLDFTRPPGGIRNVPQLAAHAARLADAVERAVDQDVQLLVLGGDCSVLLGTLLGLCRRGRHGLIFLDGHCDFATPAISGTGGAAGMDLRLAAGRLDHPLARLDPSGPVVREEDVIVLARKDLQDEPYYGADSIRRTAIRDLPLDDLQERGLDAAVEQALAIASRPGLDGFWVHFDVDVLDPEILPAVDSPEPGGLTLDEAARLLRPLLASPRARGLEVTIYDPGLDPDRTSARRAVGLLETVFAGPGRRP